jgi:hypothetical protein
MKTTRDVATRRTARRSPIASLVLMTLAVAALAAGCIQGHDPRTDGSRIDAHPRTVPALANQIKTI